MAPDSKMWMGVPSARVSEIAGIRPLGLMEVNQGSFCTSLVRSTGTVLYGWRENLADILWV